MVLPCRREHDFQKISCSRAGSKKDPKLLPKKDPKRVPGGSQSGKIDAQNRCLILGGFSSRFLTIFGIPKGPPGTSQNEPKTRQKPDSAPGGLRGVILEPCWIHFGATGGPFSSLRRSIFECPGAFFLIPLWSSSSSFSFSALPLSPLFFLFVLLRLCWNFRTFSRTIFGALSGASSRPALAEIPAQTAERGRGARPRSLTRMLSGSAGCAGESYSLLIRSLASKKFAMLSCYRGSLLCFCCLTLSEEGASRSMIARFCC